MLSFTSGGTRIAVEWFAAGGGPAAPALLLLHGADGLSFAEGYRLAARTFAAAGYPVGFVHYLDRTGDRRVAYSRLRQDFPLWAGTVRDAVGWLARQPGVDAQRIGLVGVSLGAALAFETAASLAGIRAIVDYFGPLPEGLAARRPRLPPTLILHGARDPIVPVAQAHAIARLLAEQGTPHEIRIYPDQGHALVGAAQFDAAARVRRFLQRHLSGA
ncbi:dienelactone hydrolase family protein [Methylobacterium sp. WSM2598]|uniref:dienelactone hydrolase family protein n=1 Tax=Methylobacterium sp. WSM2598 TaxID=398261 RepID=UPI000373EE89|nr:dienelactone hydrolase family protein [Methylobacterium sp. WSM2598]